LLVDQRAHRRPMVVPPGFALVDEARLGLRTWYVAIREATLVGSEAQVALDVKVATPPDYLGIGLGRGSRVCS
jgi:hypothetical protein